VDLSDKFICSSHTFKCLISLKSSPPPPLLLLLSYSYSSPPTLLLLLSFLPPYREGLATPLAYTPLSEAWSDHLFYFSTLSFKRSGNYTVSFLVEGKDVGGVKPLVFPVTVVSKVGMLFSWLVLDWIESST
jgi:hypothetical protein